MTTDTRLGDWREVLPGTYDPAHAVVVTDPPYGLASSGGPARFRIASRQTGSALLWRADDCAYLPRLPS
jgi:hypothetical protein